MGGKDNQFGNGANDVYLSTDNGHTFALVSANVSWTARSDFGFAFFPGTNTVMIAGGSNNGGGANLADIWVSQDGRGAVWTQVASLPGVGAYADCAMVALFDAAPPSTPYSTVIMAPSTSTSVWASTNLGQSWQAVGTQPWYPSRQNNQLTADADNYMYATGGFADGRLYFSWDKGATWTIIEQSASSAYTNPVEYASSTNNCQFLRYVAATASMASHPQLVIYGGGATIQTLNNATHGDCTRTGVEVVYGDVVFPTTVTGGGSGVSGTGYMCMMFYGLPGNVDYPWSVATSLTFQYTTLSSGAVSITSGSGTRGYTDRFGTFTSTAVTVGASGTGGADNVLYLGSTSPFDANGLALTLAQAVQFPGSGPLATSASVTVRNSSSAQAAESLSFRTDPAGTVFLSSVPGFLNVSIGASNLNALAPVYSQCAAAITFTNGLRPFIEAGPSNSQPQFRYSYTISDGLTYTISAALLFTAASQFASQTDSIGSPYQVISTVTGVRNYTWTQTGQTLSSRVTGLSTQYGMPDQRWYAFSLLASSPGVYSTSTAPFLSAEGVEFNISPAAPAAGMAPGSGTQYSATNLFITNSGGTPVLVDGLFTTSTPVITYQQQTLQLGPGS